MRLQHVINIRYDDTIIYIWHYFYISPLLCSLMCWLIVIKVTCHFFLPCLRPIGWLHRLARQNFLNVNHKVNVRRPLLVGTVVPSSNRRASSISYFCTSVLLDRIIMVVALYWTSFAYIMCFWNSKVCLIIFVTIAPCPSTLNHYKFF